MPCQNLKRAALGLAVLAALAVSAASAAGYVYLQKRVERVVQLQKETAEAVIRQHALAVSDLAGALEHERSVFHAERFGVVRDAFNDLNELIFAVVSAETVGGKPRTREIAITAQAARELASALMRAANRHEAGSGIREVCPKDEEDCPYGVRLRDGRFAAAKGNVR